MAIPFDLTFYLLAIPAMIFAGFSKAGLGSGAAFAGGAVMVLVVEPVVALGLVLPLLMLVDAVTLRPYWGRWDFRSCYLVILGALPGVALGVVLYKIANADHFRIMIGAICLLFVAWQILRKQGFFDVRQGQFGAGVGLFTGLVAGFTSFVSHAGGPPVAIYMLSQNAPKTVYQASSVLIFWAINIFKAFPYAFLGIFTLDTLMADAILAPFVLFGAWLGVKAHFKISERLFFGITYVALALTGAKLLWDGLF